MHRGNAASMSCPIQSELAVVDLSHLLVGPAKVSHWFQRLPPEHPRTCPGDHPNQRWRSFLPRLCELCHDSRQRDIQPREPSRRHESCLLIRVADDSHWMGSDNRPASRSLQLGDSGGVLCQGSRGTARDIRACVDLCHKVEVLRHRDLRRPSWMAPAGGTICLGLTGRPRQRSRHRS